MAKERTVFGKYRVIARLGRGGMGNVYLAVNIGPGGVAKLVVVKELREELASVPEARSMFLDEARIATRLNHPNVVQTFEVVEEGESLYLTMEFLDGQPLQNVIRGDKRARIPLPLQVRILADALGAMHYAHELTDYDGAPLSVVHRDVSPHNIFVTYDGTAKLVDFGIAKANDARTVTESGVFKGKVRFSSPEQAMGTDIDRRTDIFAAGGVLWEIVTGEPMWKGLSDAKILLELASGKIPQPRSVKADLPPRLEAICRKALAVSREDRFATAAAFRESLLEYLHEEAPAGDLHVALREAMAAAFERERREIRATIDAEIRAIREEAPASIRERRLPLLGSVPTSASVHTGLAHARAARPQPSGRRVVTVALLVCCLFAFGLYTIFTPQPRRSARAAASASSPAEVAPAPSAAGSFAPALAPSVHLRLRAQPPAARFVIDDASVPANPYEADVPADAVVHGISVQADGYDPRRLQTAFDRDVVLDVVLAPSAPVPPAAGARPAHPAHSGAGPAPPPTATATAKGQRPIEEEDPYKK
jgi:tRNA A-37 threonylcarbamoyl transferase component Bud32